MKKPVLVIMAAGCGTVWLFDIFLLQIVYLYLVGIFALRVVACIDVSFHR